METSKILQVDYCTHNNPLLDYLQEEEINTNDLFERQPLTLLGFDSHNNIGKFNHENSEKPYFVKFCPLVDPIKYITNSYTEQKVISNSETLDLEKYIYNKEYKLPLHNDNTFEDNMKKLKHKINYPMNCAYIDTMFMYLSNLLHTKFDFQHGLRVYDSFTSIKHDYRIDIGDSLECIDQNKGMYRNVKQEFVEFEDRSYHEMYIETNNIAIDSDDEDDFINNDSRTRKPILNILSNDEDDALLNSEINETACVLDIDEIDDIEVQSDGLVQDDVLHHELNIDEDEEEFKINPMDSDSSYESDDDNSNESFTDEEQEEDSDDLLQLVDHKELNMEVPMDEESYSESETNSEEENEDGSSYDSESDSECDPEVFVRIKKIPVQTVIMEKCKNTLDFLLDNDMINMEELKSALFQVLMNLLCYQKTLKMTHNDLHTNNVMYVSTKRKFLYYILDGVQYKVPTFGKIYKVIDFGRSIFHYKGRAFASDSFNKNEDADTQYNCEPFFDNTKKRIENNFSFDVCRLGCSLYDFFIDSPEDIPKMEEVPIVKLIMSWVEDDNGKNILYKSDGSTRYPGFKIYKMIARSVHNHTPEMEIKKEIFEHYLMQNNKDESLPFMNMDKLDEFTTQWLS